MSGHNIVPHQKKKEKIYLLIIKLRPVELEKIIEDMRGGPW